MFFATLSSFRAIYVFIILRYQPARDIWSSKHKSWYVESFIPYFGIFHRYLTITDLLVKKKRKKLITTAIKILPDSSSYVYYNFIYSFLIGKVSWGVSVLWPGSGGTYFNKATKTSNADGGTEPNWFSNTNSYQWSGIQGSVNYPLSHSWSPCDTFVHTYPNSSRAPMPFSFFIGEHHNSQSNKKKTLQEAKKTRKLLKARKNFGG